MWGKAAIGKIFISHATADKSFVRGRIVTPLEAAGYETWVDEKELFLGDPLPRKVSQGIRAAKVLIVTISTSSVESNWLAYELNVAADLMIKGSLRLIPVVIDGVAIPSELEGLLYADMRKGVRGGFKKIIAALEYEASRYPKPPMPASVTSENSYLRGLAYEAVISDEAGRGFFDAWVDISATRSVDWKGITLLDVDVRVDMVHSYINSTTFTSSDLNDWIGQLEETSNDFGILLFEGEISTEVTAKFRQLSTGVWVQSIPAGIFQGSCALVIVEVSPVRPAEQIEKSLRESVRLITRYIETREPALMEGAKSNRR
ncbi:toll/interleukin-1 receptor domain-containing protein [Streptomyces griseoluteus]